MWKVVQRRGTLRRWRRSVSGSREGGRAGEGGGEGAGVLKKYYFLDGSVLMCARPDSPYRRRVELARWLDKNPGRFFMNETAKQRCGFPLPHYITYFHSNIPAWAKQGATERIAEAIGVGQGGAGVLLDIHVILEASWSRWGEETGLPIQPQTFALLTGNGEVYQQTYGTEERRSMMEVIINETGLDHFVPLELVDDINFDESLDVLLPVDEKT
eukprot:TRINITY_DN26265_c0_g1_i1.p1 TRINITY_DN26265_c0_g1~~TRINITY_DN26265_c0_g1_i1.p1  ORF type:complete len:222 (+),score=16.21 TRINITY_DN26265_c0_g1_i1:25-666(+)